MPAGGRQGVTAREADYVAQMQIDYWTAEGWTPDEMIQAVIGAKFVCGYSLSTAQKVIADAWRGLQ